MASSDEPLVSTEWLAAHLGDSRIKVIDATFKMPGVLPLPVDDFRSGHIPGAAFFDVDAVSDHASTLPHMYPDGAQFARDVAALGISDDDTVVVYDAGGWVAAPRAWWMFLSFGHREVRILDGGLRKWRAEGHAVEAGDARPRPGRYRAATLDPRFIRSQAQMIANLDAKTEQVVDARAAGRFDGSVAEPRPGLRAGHIPGSRNLPYDLLFDADTGTMRPLAALRAAFAAAGVDVARPVVTTCGSGVSAAVLTLALYRLGLRGSALYDGSWSEWGVEGGPPVATGPA